MSSQGSPSGSRSGIGDMVAKEILGHVLSLRFGVAFILILLLVSASIHVSIYEYRRNVDTYHSRMQVHQKEVESVLKEEKDWERYRRLFWDVGVSAAIPVSSLSWLGQGLQPTYPAAVNVRGDWQVRAIRPGIAQNPLRGLLRIPDFVYVVSVVLSFLAVLFMFDAVSGEKEDGTLRLMLSNPVPRYAVLLGKWAGGALVLLVPFLLATTGALAYARFSGVLQPADTGRAILVVGIACLYLAVFLNVALFVSTLTHRASTALLTCLLIWVLFILVIPNMAPVTARILEPTPPLETIAAEKRAVDQEMELKIRRLTLTSGELAYGQRIRDETEKLERERERRKNQWDQYYKDSLARQSGLAQTLSRISPSACWTFAALGLTHTGPADYTGLKQARETLAADVEHLRTRLRSSLKPHQEPPPGWSKVAREDIPALRIRTIPVAAAVSAALNDILLLIILGILFFMASFMRFLRYDVR